MSKKVKVIFFLCLFLGICCIVGGGLLIPSKNIYEVVFDSNGGSSISSQMIEENKKVLVPSDPIKMDFEFIGWEINGKSYDFKTPVTKNIILKAKWKEKEKIQTFVVSFDSDGGSSVDNQIIEEEGMVVKPKDPVKEGFQFVEWQLDEKKYEFSTKVINDLNLKAKWAKIQESLPKYIIKFNSNGGNNITAQTVIKNNLVLRPNNPTKNGYKFVEWQLDGKPYDFNTKVIKEFTLKAVWRPNAVYTITFNCAGGSIVDKQTVVEGNKVSKPKNPTKDNLVFDGWYLNGSLYDFNSIVSSNITLVAKWNSPPNENLINAKTIASRIDNLNIKIETLNENIIENINVLEGCRVDITNLPSQIEREISDKTISLNFNITCANEKLTKNKNAIIVASPYKYTKVMNGNMLNYDVTINGGNWNGNAKLFLGNSGSFNVIGRKAIVEINKIESNPLFLMKFNDNSKVIYHVPFNDK